MEKTKKSLFGPMDLKRDVLENDPDLFAAGDFVVSAAAGILHQ